MISLMALCTTFEGLSQCLSLEGYQGASSGSNLLSQPYLNSDDVPLVLLYYSFSILKVL